LLWSFLHQPTPAIKASAHGQTLLISKTGLGLQCSLKQLSKDRSETKPYLLNAAMPLSVRRVGKAIWRSVTPQEYLQGGRAPHHNSGSSFPAPSIGTLQDDADAAN
jgi:hypothetical protein